ncbi:hypothetical protein [Emticicia agri]|uniref:YihY/virulence factor BrkB family protein n=1 Tax=Emticicia agri TaxID=2492393 RepID=A0A4Q5LSY9_9BACT|nr:hypothetical protein [Emticicia agri]RYU92625.1 hypothetical protein EWM59_26220 [Emticicia agri]
MFTILSQAFNRTARNLKMVLTVFIVNIALGLILAVPLYNVLQVEADSSIEFNRLINGFDLTVIIDFLNKSGKSLPPFWLLGFVLSLIYLVLNIFFAGGILSQFALRGTFRISEFLKNSMQYFGRFFLVFLIEAVALVGVCIVAFILLGVSLIASGDSTEPVQMAWLTPSLLVSGFLFTVVLNIGNYAKVILFKNLSLNAWLGFWKATSYIFQNFKTMRIYWAILVVAVILVLVYLFLESAIGMNSALKIFVMFIVQQAFVFGRVFMKMWMLSGAFEYLTLKPVPIPPSPVLVVSGSTETADNTSNKLSE